MNQEKIGQMEIGRKQGSKEENGDWESQKEEEGEQEGGKG